MEFSRSVYSRIKHMLSSSIGASMEFPTSVYSRIKHTAVRLFCSILLCSLPPAGPQGFRGMNILGPSPMELLKEGPDHADERPPGLELHAGVRAARLLRCVSGRPLGKRKSHLEARPRREGGNHLCFCSRVIALFLHFSLTDTSVVGSR